MKYIFCHYFRFIVPDYGKQDSIFHVVEIIILRFAGNENIGSRSNGFGYQECSAASANGYLADGFAREHRMFEAANLKQFFHPQKESGSVFFSGQRAGDSRTGSFPGVGQRIKVERRFLVWVGVKQGAQNGVFAESRQDRFDAHLLFRMQLSNLAAKGVATLACTESSFPARVEAARIIMARMPGACFKQGVANGSGMGFGHECG